MVSIGCQLMFGWQRSYNPRTTHMEHGITWADLYQVNNSPSVCERDMLKVPGRTKRSDVENFYLEQPVFTLTCWSLSELGGGCFWQTVAGSDRKSHPPRQDSTDAGFGSTGKLHHSSNIHQTKKALCPITTSCGSNFGIKENADFVSHQATLSFLFIDVR